MKVKPNQKILFYDGTPLLDENKKEILVRDAIINAINAIDSGDEKIAYFFLLLSLGLFRL